jgi:hypothetical protein
LVQIATQVFPFLEIPNWVIRLVIALVVIGFPIALVIAWAFEATPEGIKRTEIADAMPGAVGQKKHAWIYLVVICGAISVALFFSVVTPPETKPRQRLTTFRINRSQFTIRNAAIPIVIVAKTIGLATKLIEKTKIPIRSRAKTVGNSGYRARKLTCAQPIREYRIRAP